MGINADSYPVGEVLRFFLGSPPNLEMKMPAKDLKPQLCTATEVHCFKMNHLQFSPNP